MASVHNQIPKFVNTFFESCEIDKNLNRYSFFLVRADGVVLYHNENLAKGMNKASIGALLGGVWQASKALSDFIPQKKNSDVFRLSFDTSSQGVYIIPISVLTEEFYLGLIYHDEVNPGFLKNKIRDLAFAFTEYMHREMQNTKHTLHIEKTRSEFLFSDISDAEMDKLFHFVKD